MNQNIELIKQLRSFCEQYDGVSCIECPVFLVEDEDYCPLLSIINRLAKKEFGYDENGDIDLPI